MVEYNTIPLPDANSTQQYEANVIRCICDICHKLLHDNTEHNDSSERMNVRYYHVEEIYPQRYTGDGSNVHYMYDYCPVCMTQVFDNEILSPNDDMPPMERCKYLIDQRIVQVWVK